MRSKLYILLQEYIIKKSGVDFFVGIYRKSTETKNEEYMNTVQNILNVIIKMAHQRLFQTGLTAQEEVLMTSIKQLKVKYFRISTLRDGGFILTWESAFSQNPIACRITDEELKFSDPIIYKSSTSNVKGSAEEVLSPEYFELLKKEIKDIKKIFRAYSPEIEKHFT